MKIILKEDVQPGIRVFFVETVLLSTQKQKSSLADCAHLESGILFKHFS